MNNTHIARIETYKKNVQNLINDLDVTAPINDLKLHLYMIRHNVSTYATLINEIEQEIQNNCEHKFVIDHTVFDVCHNTFYCEKCGKQH